MSAPRPAGAAALLLALAMARVAHSQPPVTAAPPLAAPRLSASGVAWGSPAEPVPVELEPWRRSLDATASDSARMQAWRALVHRPRWHPFALRRLTEALAQLHADTLAAERAATGLRLGEVLRGARQYGDADRALGRAEHDADPPTLARIALERARVSRDGGKPDLAVSRFGRAAELARDPGLRELCLWERARAQEQDGEWSKARDDYARVVALGRARA